MFCIGPCWRAALVKMQDAEQTRRELGRVCLSPPDPSWPAHFRRERERLRPFLGSIANELQHYGSTAVAGLSAKPVIDMMAPVGSLDEAGCAGRRSRDGGISEDRCGLFQAAFLSQES